MTDPKVTEFRYRGNRNAHIENVYEAQGVSGYSLYDPDNPPFEVSQHGVGGSLSLEEREAREIHRRLGEIIGEWDASAVRTFLKMRPQYSVEHVITIARQMGLDGIPFCLECADWHMPDEEHSSEEG